MLQPFNKHKMASTKMANTLNGVTVFPLVKIFEN